MKNSTHTWHTNTRDERIALIHNMALTFPEEVILQGEFNINVNGARGNGKSVTWCEITHALIPNVKTNYDVITEKREQRAQNIKSSGLLIKPFLKAASALEKIFEPPRSIEYYEGESIFGGRTIKIVCANAFCDQAHCDDAIELIKASNISIISSGKFSRHRGIKKIDLFIDMQGTSDNSDRSMHVRSNNQKLTNSPEFQAFVATANHCTHE